MQPLARSSHPARRQSDLQPQRGWNAALALAATVALVDWGTKLLIYWLVPVGAFVEVWPERIALWHVHNPAMMLGLWEDLPLGSRGTIALLAAAFTVVAFGDIVRRSHRLARHHQPWAWTFAGLVLGGVAGNLGERAVRWSVTDFLSLHVGQVWLPPGNVADLALFSAIPLAVPVIWFELRARAGRGKGAAPRRSVYLASGDEANATLVPTASLERSAGL